MDNKPLITIIDEPEHIEIDMGEMAVITNQNHASLKNLDYANSGHTGFASQADVEMLMGKIEGKSQSFTVNTLAELGNLFNLTITEAADNYMVTTSHIIYKGKEYSLYNGNEFYIIQQDVPDYWFSLDTMTLYKMETKAGEAGGIEQLVGTEEKPINWATDLEPYKPYMVKGYAVQSATANRKLDPNLKHYFLCYKYVEYSSLDYVIIFNNNNNNLSLGSTARIGFDRTTGYENYSTVINSMGIKVNSTSSNVPVQIYAPTEKGSAGQVLMSEGGSSPVWADLPSGGIEQLVGTDEKPINFATDMELGKCYIISGKCYYFDTLNRNFSGYCLCHKIEPQRVILYGCAISSQDANPIFGAQYVTNFTFNSTTGQLSSLRTFPYISKFNDSSLPNEVSFYAPTASGTSGQILQSKGSGAPTWVTPNYATLDDVNNAINGMWEESY